MKLLHPGAKWHFRISAYVVMLFLAFFISWFIAPIFIFLTTIIFKASIGAVFLGVLLFLISYIIISILIAEIYARMSYNRWLYEFTDTNLKTEKGIIWKKYSNVPYERVQNVDIRRGIIARMLGFSSVMIQTAGYSYGARGGMSTEGYLPAVSIEEAEQIREFLMKKITKRGRNQGL